MNLDNGGEVNETPSWLTDDPPAPAPAAAAAPPSPSPAPVPAAPAASVPVATPVPSSNAAAPTNAPADPEVLAAVEKEQLKGIILLTRVLNLGLSIAVITHSILLFIGLPSAPKIWVLSIYAGLGGCLICCLETQLKFIRTAIAINFGFLFHPTLRFLFYLLMASVNFSLRGVFGWTLGSVFIGVALYNTYVLCRYPAYRKLRDELAREEDARIEKKIKKKIAKETTRAMFTHPA